MLKTLLKRALLLLLVFGVVWLCVLMWWHETKRIPSRSDMLLYLAGLPSALVATYAVLQSTLGGIYKALAAPSVPAASAPAPEPEAQRPVAPDGQFKVRLLHASMRCALGNSAHAVVEALAIGRRAGVDPVLRDPRDFPVYAARVGTLDAGRVAELHTALVAFDSSITWNDENVRTLALLNDVMMEAYQAVNSYTEAHPHHNAARHVPPRLHLVTLIPTHWNGNTRDTVERWLHTQSKLHKSEAPNSHVVMASSAPHTAFIEVDRMLATLNHDDAPDFHIIAAAQSDLDTRLIADYDASDAIFTGARQHAAILGEAATALVLRAAAKPAADGRAAAPASPEVYLARAAFGQLSAPINDTSDPSPETLGRIAENTLAATSLKNQQIRALYADAGSHATRNGELTQFAFQHFPTLIRQRECAPLDGGCGITGAAGALLTIALAGHHVKQTQSAALAATLADPQERAALIAVPGTQAFNET